jgi:hypothetical protein
MIIISFIVKIFTTKSIYYEEQQQQKMCQNANI